MPGGDRTTVQDKLLEMMTYFHEFCREHKLRYYMIGGTMLGAVRHKGFIPWDDDIDIGMPRVDYEELKSITQDQNYDKYRFETVLSKDSAYRLSYSKLYDSSSTLIENTRVKLVRGLYIDLFPIDGVGDDLNAARNLYYKIHALETILKLRNSPDKNDRALLKNIGIYIVRAIPTGIANEKKLALKIDKECQRYKFEDSLYAGNLMGAWGWREIMPREYFGTPKLYSFESYQFYGVEKYDEFLSQIYGEWKKLPPVEKRVSHHDYFLDLTAPYIQQHTKV